MKARLPRFAWLWLPLLLVVVPGAGTGSALVLGSRDFSRRFDTRQLEHRFWLEQAPGPAQSIDLRLRISTALTGEGQGRNARAALVNACISFYLPENCELLLVPRAYFIDRDGKEQLLYSGNYPALPRFRSLPPLGRPSAASWDQLFAHLRASSLALDPAASIVEPPALGSSRHSSRDPRACFASWTIPVDVGQHRLPDLFSTRQGGSAPEIIVRLRLKLKEPQQPARLDLSAAAFSVAAVIVDAPASLAPPGAILLNELDPQAYPRPESSEGSVSDSTDPAAIAAAEAPEPMLVFSGDWLSWEENFTLGPALADPAGRVNANNRGLQQTSAALRDSQVRAAESALEHEPEAASPASAAPASTAAQADHSESPALPTDAGSLETSTARLVQLGTLPGQEQDQGEIPLRPITGSSGVRASSSSPQFGSAGDGATLPPVTGYPGSTPGSTRFYGPGGPPNQYGGPNAPPPMAAPGLGTMVLVPGGEFRMGTDAGTPYGDADELPQHTVYLPDYFIDKYPVTNRQFGEFAVLAGYKSEGDWQRYSSPSMLDMPVRNVSWNDANAYARWAGKRLPTEAEWEKAARGTDGRLFPWGNDWNADILPRGELGYQLLVAPQAASPCGALAMVGVLWQWTSTPWHEYPFDPQARGDKMILRGGAFSNGRNIVRCANRYFEPPQVALNTFTFRCVRDKQ